MSSEQYSVSPTKMSELEKVWLESREGLASQLQIHQCLAVFFDILGTDKPDEQWDALQERCLGPLFEEIGKRLGLSPQVASQRFREAKKGGILSVSAKLAVDMATKLQQELSKIFQSSLRVIVGEVENRYSPKDEDRVNAVAEAATDYFVNVVPQKCLAAESGLLYSSGWIGVSGGDTMLKVVQHIIAREEGQYEGLTVIPLAGEAEPEEFGISANSVALRLAEACVPGKVDTYSLMTTPIVVADKDEVDKLRGYTERSQGIKKVIDLAKHVKFAFTGIGAVEKESEKDKGAGRESKEGESKKDAITRLKNYCEIGASIPDKVVGDICYRPIDTNGEDAWPELSCRLVGPTLQDLQMMSATPERRVFAVACGRKKVEPIIAAFRNGLVNGLITDELTALEILNHLEDLAKRESKESKSTS